VNSGKRGEHVREDGVSVQVRTVAAMKHVTASQGVNLSQRFFNKTSLFFYDLLLYGVVSKYAWGCSIRRLDAHYRKYTSANHLEVGVGTGFLLNRVAFDAAHPRVALMDLSRECLNKTGRVVARYTPETYVQNLLEPVNQRIAQFDSIAINYVLHCVPGDFKEKGVVFTHLQALLTDDGVLFGTTVLSEQVRKNALAKLFMWLMNSLGVFNNRHDNECELKECLAAHFRVLQFELVGVTALFAVKNR
jgi:ubiquinone/menaquinone biosynthesis C-methylase UbiE